MDLFFYLILLAVGFGAAEGGGPAYDPGPIYEQPLPGPDGGIPPMPGQDGPDIAAPVEPVGPEEPSGPEEPVGPQEPAGPDEPAAPQEPDTGEPEGAGPEGGAAAQPGEGPRNPDEPEGGWTASQDPPGRMTSALEVRPILTVTKPQWVAVREQDGRDLLYFTNLLAWRCGLYEVRYSINGDPPEILPMEPCHLDEGTPNAIKSDGIPAYVELPGGSVGTVHVEILYDDLGTDSADYNRADIQTN